MGIFKNLKGKVKPAAVDTPVGPPVDSVIEDSLPMEEESIVEEVKPVKKAQTTTEKLAAVQKELEDLKKEEEAEAAKVAEEPAEEEPKEAVAEQEITIQQVLENFDMRLKRLEYHNRLLL